MVSLFADKTLHIFVDPPHVPTIIRQNYLTDLAYKSSIPIGEAVWWLNAQVAPSPWTTPEVADLGVYRTIHALATFIW